MQEVLSNFTHISTDYRSERTPQNDEATETLTRPLEFFSNIHSSPAPLMQPSHGPESLP